ncbi:hypothetical protein BA20089_07085 [Bifidobacterium asteroides DSM 20089]|uniref:Uncharacterized protein n=1 Tax=Bifidobacterium asteroides DSM 20089 TaxID=1437594 RepID=A0AAD0ABV4_9BIFI|nr:hypothetical protein BA20089_07085 [Bifidobacterium asteroides DSM 20089]
MVCSFLALECRCSYCNTRQGPLRVFSGSDQGKNQGGDQRLGTLVREVGKRTEGERVEVEG